MEWVELVGLARDKAAVNEFQTLISAYKEDPEKWRKIFTFCTFNNDWYYMDGKKRVPFEKRQ